MTRNPVLKGLFHVPIQEFGERVGMQRGSKPSVLNVPQPENLEIIRHHFRLRQPSRLKASTVDKMYTQFKVRFVRQTFGELCPEERSEILKYFNEYNVAMMRDMSRPEMEDYCRQLLLS
jgi:hypothetical protein